MCTAVVLEQPSLAFICSLRPAYPAMICSRCMARFERIGPQYCSGCGRQMEERGLCMDCQRWQQLYPRQHFVNRALLTYNEPMQQYFQQYKGLGDYRLRHVFQRLIRENFPAQRHTAYVPVPTDPAHLQRRGFDPVVGLYKDCLPLVPLLQKLPTEKGQAQKNRAERLATPQFFKCHQEVTLSADVQRLILLDDIYTTGRTLWHAQQCLRKRYQTLPIQAMTLVR